MPTRFKIKRPLSKIAFESKLKIYEIKDELEIF